MLFQTLDPVALLPLHPDPHAVSILLPQVTQLNVVLPVTVEMTFREGACNTAAKFFPEGKLWYAFFNGNEYSNNCCGNGATPF